MKSKKSRAYLPLGLMSVLSFSALAAPGTPNIAWLPDSYEQSANIEVVLEYVVGGERYIMGAVR